MDLRDNPWSLFDAFYFCFVTLTTVGMGDSLPAHDLTRLILIAYIYVGLGAMASLIATLTNIVS